MTRPQTILAPSPLAVRLELARRHLLDFGRTVIPTFEQTPFHRAYYRVLEAFARGRIHRLIVSVPPQHGKSLGSSVLLPAFLLGIDPNLRIATASYALSHAVKFNRQVQRIIDGDLYPHIFPRTRLSGMAGTKGKKYARTSENFEVVGYDGGLLSVGREGPLTGNAVDVMILDDLYKDAMEANSSLIRDNAWEWYTKVVKTRLHNRSREVIVFTRWHEEDIIGRLEKTETVIELSAWDQLEGLDPRVWVKVNFEAIKESDPTQIDPRKPGEALWENRHSIEKLRSDQRLDPVGFAALHQGNPCTREGLLYGEGFQTYQTLPGKITKMANYTDTADTGTDYLCSVCYVVGDDRMIYVTDVLYTSEGMEVTEGATARMLERNSTRIAYIESNNGGRGFARTVGKLAPATRIQWFHQSANKEARILTNSATVLGHIRMPADWRLRWPEFYAHLVAFRRVFRANRNDDAPDVLTGIVEREVMKNSGNAKYYFG